MNDERTPAMDVLSGVLTHPVKTFSDLSAHPRLGLGILVLVVIAFAGNFATVIAWRPNPAVSVVFLFLGAASQFIFNLFILLIATGLFSLLADFLANNKKEKAPATPFAPKPEPQPVASTDNSDFGNAEMPSEIAGEPEPLQSAEMPRAGNNANTKRGVSLFTGLCLANFPTILLIPLSFIALGSHPALANLGVIIALWVIVLQITAVSKILEIPGFTATVVFIIPAVFLVAIFTVYAMFFSSLLFSLFL